VRTTALTGAVLGVAAVAVVMLSSSFGLDVESVALMGAATGAVVALVPHGLPLGRLLGFLVGFGSSWIAYLLRAGLLPDTRVGHAIAVAFVIVVCTLAAGLSRGRMPLWSTLLGAAALAGSYEATYLQAPSQVLRTSTESSTIVLLAVALGFFAAALVAPGGEGVAGGPSAPQPERPAADTSEAESSIDDVTKESSR
jgi:hypothetical protein